VIIYELLDEMMDFGYPQTTESKILQEYITQESHKLEIQVRPPMAVTNAVSWRSEGIRYRKNEVFLVSPFVEGFGLFYHPHMEIDPILESFSHIKGRGRKRQPVGQCQWQRGPE
jgi:hypothetical protein